MNTAYTKGAVISLWLLSVLITGLVAGVSQSTWIILAGVAAVPPAVMLKFWGVPALSVSERVSRGRR